MAKNTDEFDEDFDDEDLDEEDEDDEDDEEDWEDDKVEDKNEEKKKLPAPKPKTSVPAKAKKPAEDEFVPYHYPERTGIIDRRTKQPVGEDIYTILASIMSSLRRIEERLE